jgi:flagellar assembly protein FliH
MNSFFRTASSPELQKWEAPELAMTPEASAIQIQTDEIVALFGMGQNNASSRRDIGSRSNLHSNGGTLALTNWLPDDIQLQPKVTEPAVWDFVETALDSFKVAEASSVKNRSESEKEKAQLLHDARMQADDILNQARVKAEQILQNAQTEMEQMRQSGYQNGWQTARDELEGAIAATRELVQETHQWQASLLKEGEQVLVEMLKDLAQTMFGEGVRLDAEALQINLNRIMEKAQRLGDLNIFLNPRDASQLDTSWRDYQLLITGNKVSIIPSEKIKPGGCVIKGNMGMVDARVETQLAAVLNTMSEVSEADK